MIAGNRRNQQTPATPAPAIVLVESTTATRWGIAGRNTPDMNSSTVNSKREIGRDRNSVFVASNVLPGYSLTYKLQV